MYLEFDAGQKYSSNKDADVADSANSFNDAGWILEDDDLVVDIDDLTKDAIQRMIDLFGIKTQIVWTNRGAHLYFKKPKRFRRRDAICALGCKIEYKHSGNTRAVTIKQNGKMRTVINEGKREALPWFLAPEKKGQYQDLLGMSAGEGRNDALYAHKRALRNRNGWKTVLQFINQSVFAEPMDADEFESVARAEAVPTAAKDAEYAMAEYVKGEIDYLQYGQTYFYRDDETGNYIADENVLRQKVYAACGQVQTRYVDEVIRQMQYRCRIIPDNEVFKIKLKNGYLFDGEFVDVKFNEFTPYSIDVSYDPDAKAVELVDEYIDNLTGGDKEYRTLLMEILGHTLIVDPEFKRLLAKFFIFVGDGGNGKGTLLQIIKQILNPKNCTGMSIKDLTDERYLNTFKGKLANLGDDIQDQAINNSDMKMLKNLSTCDYISSRELYKNAEQTQFTGSLIFTSNHLIKSFEKGTSYKRRVLWLPMYSKVDKKDPLFITKLTTPEALEYWMRLIVDGYLRLYQNGGFSESAKVADFNREYHEENNPYLIYLSDITPDNLIGTPVSDVYRDCEMWCEDNSVEFSKAMFRGTLKEIFKLDTTGVKKENGKTARVMKRIAT